MSNSSGNTGDSTNSSATPSGGGIQLPGSPGLPSPAPTSPTSPTNVPVPPSPATSPTPALSNQSVTHPAPPTGATPPQPTSGAASTPDASPESRWRDKPNIIGLLTLGAAVVAVGLTIYYGNDSSDSGRSQAKSGEVQATTGVSEAERQPKLKVARVAAYLKKGIDGTDKAESENLKDLRGPHLDITFENRAPGPSLITRATLRLREAGQLPRCNGSGGELEISMNYDFPMPLELPKTPYEKAKDISFTVEDNKLDRLTLTMGPETVGWGPAWYGVADIVFDHDGVKTTVGPIAVVDAGGDSAFYPEGDTWVIESVNEPSCLDETAALVDRLKAIPGITASKELTSLRDKLTSMGH